MISRRIAAATAIAISLASISTVQAGSLNSRNPFCVLTNNSGGKNGPAFKVQAAKELGVPYIRATHANVPMLDQENAKAWSILSGSGLMNIETFRSASTGNEAASPPASLEDYKVQLAHAIDVTKPTLVSIENEEAVPKFYTGTAQQYIQELKAAVQVAHQKGLEVTNGGLTMPYLGALVVENYLSHGQTAQAQAYATRLGNGGIGMFERGLDAARSRPQYAQAVATGRVLLAGYIESGIDYINFHWYVPDATALEETANFLSSAARKPVVTNEIGQHDKNPATVTALMQKVVDLNIPLACWYDGDGSRAFGLHTSDGSLRESGNAFKEFIRTHF